MAKRGRPNKPPNLMFEQPDEIYAEIERDTDMPFGWYVKVCSGPVISSTQWTFTRAGARHAARRGVALYRRRLTRKTDREEIR